MVEKKIRIYGHKPDPVSIIRKPRARKFTAGTLPRKVSLRSQMPPIFDQGQLGSCTANAFCGLLGFLQLKYEGKFDPKSRLFLYYNERASENTIQEDAGAMPIDGIKSLQTQGICPESLWGYDISQFTVQPPANCYQSALALKLLKNQSLSTLEDMMDCLASGYPFALDMQVYPGLEGDTVAQNGKLPMPTPGEQCLGGHYVDVIGYDLDIQLFPGSAGSLEVRNSWGASWGDAGHFWMPIEYVTNITLMGGALTSDYWELETDEADQPQPTYGTIRGIVTDARGAPIVGAIVNAGVPGTTHILTDGSGYYSINMMIAGTYNVSVSAPNCLTANATVGVSLGIIVSQNFTLAPIPTPQPQPQPTPTPSPVEVFVNQILQDIKDLENVLEGFMAKKGMKRR